MIHVYGDYALLISRTLFVCDCVLVLLLKTIYLLTWVTYPIIILGYRYRSYSPYSLYKAYTHCSVTFAYPFYDVL